MGRRISVVVFGALLPAGCEPDETCVEDRVAEASVGVTSSANWPEGPHPGGGELGGFESTCTVGTHSSMAVPEENGAIVRVELSCLSAVDDYRPVELIIGTVPPVPELAIYDYPGEVTLRTETEPEISGTLSITDAESGQDLLFAVGGNHPEAPSFPEHGRPTETALDCADPYTTRYSVSFAGLTVDDSAWGQSDTHFAIVEDAYDTPYEDDPNFHGPSGPMSTYAFFRLAQ